MFAKELTRELTNGRLLSNCTENTLKQFLHKRFVDYKSASVFISFSYQCAISSTDSFMSLPMTLFEDVKAWLEANGFRVDYEKSNVNSASMNVYLDI